MGPAAPPPSSPRDPVGRVLGGRYRLTAPLGGGASSAVFVAEDVVLRRHVAVKILHPALAADQAFLQRFQAEARVAAALRHPNVLAVHDWGDDGGTPFLVTELLECGSLKELIDRGFRATPSQALQLGLEACRGLDHAHRRGLVHRDVKPANLLFDDEAHLRVADFGLARAIAEAATEPLGAVLGTARYASPEQVEGRPLNGRSDVYSLALVLVEAVTGQVPFVADTSAATLLARLERSIEPPAAVGPLAEALAAAGQADPELRSDAATFGRMLKAAATTLDRPAPLPLVRLDPATAAGASPDDPTAHPEPAPAPSSDAGADGDGDGDGDAAGDQGAPAATAALAVVPPEPPPAPPPPARRRRRRDRRRDRAHAAVAPAVELEAPAPPKRKRGRLVLLLLLLLVVAGLAAAAASFQPWRPTVDVPQLVGLPREEAAARLRAEDLRMKVGGRTPSETVAADRVLAARPARQRQGQEVTVTLSDGPEKRLLPAVAGRPAAEVSRTLSALGLVVVPKAVDSETVPIGTALAIDPPPGSQVPRGSTVTVEVSAGVPARPVPDVVGKPASEATAALKAAGFSTAAVQIFDDKVASGSVVSTNPAPGTMVRPNMSVVVNVSKGPDLVTVPVLTGKTPAAAQQALKAAGLVASTTYGPPSGQVFSSDPKAGEKVRRGSSVALYTR